MSRIKILRIIARLNIGGPAIHTILLTEGLNPDRFETILACGNVEADEGDMAYLAEEKGIHPVVIPELGRSLNMRNDWIALSRLFRLIKREKPDIIHTHTAKAGTLGRIAGILYNAGRPVKRVKLIHTFHGHVLHSYFGRIKTALFIWIERFLGLWTDRIIAVSENLKKELLAFRVARPEKILVVALGLELEKYLQIKSNGLRQKSQKTIGIIGRLVPIKNHRMFLDAAGMLIKRAEFSGKLRFLIVGDGLLRQKLEDYAQKLGIGQDVVFTGWVKNLETTYSELDIAVLTSLNEGTPVALIEAQAAGCACVATNVGGVADVIEEGKSGYLVSSGDIQGFVDRIAALLHNPALMQSMGEYGRSRSGDRFNKKRLIGDVEKLYYQQVN